MQVTIQASDLNLNDDIKEQIETKMLGLMKYYKNILKAAVTVNRDTHKSKQGKIFKFSVDVVVPGEDIHAESMEEDLTLSLNEVTRDLTKLLKKKNEKEHEKAVRQGREFNEQIVTGEGSTEDI